MSFNENNYSVNYLIWDQETIQRDNAKRERKKCQMGQKNMELEPVRASLQMEIKFISIAAWHDYTGEIKELRGGGTWRRGRNYYEN